MQNHFLRAGSAAALLALASSLQADDPATGFGLSDLPYPAGSVTATLSCGDFVAFDGSGVDLYSESGALLTSLATLREFAFPSFVEIDPSESFVVIGESSFGQLYTVDLSSGGLTSVASLAFNYDAHFLDADTLLVSAATCGFGCGNELWRVRLSTAGTTLVATVPGSSGPVTVDGLDRVVYGTVSAVFPPPPGASDLIVWPVAALDGSPVLSEADADVLATGFDGAASLAHDPWWDELYLAENDFGTGVNRVRRVGQDAATSPILMEGTPSNALSNLEFLPGNGLAAFVAYQPANGGVLHYNTTDFGAFDARRELTTQRPALFFTGSGTSGPGPFDLVVSSAPPGGLGFTFSGPQGLVPPTEFGLFLAGLGYRLFLGLDLATMDVDLVPFAIDGAGAGAKTYVNPGGLEGSLGVQVVFLDDGGDLVGSSEVALF